MGTRDKSDTAKPLWTLLASLDLIDGPPPT